MLVSLRWSHASAVCLDVDYINSNGCNVGASNARGGGITGNGPGEAQELLRVPC